MVQQTSSELESLRKKLRACRRELRESRQSNKTLCEVLDMGVLENTWEPDPRVERQYGPAHVWSYPLYSYLAQLSSTREPVTPEVRNRVVTIFRSVLVKVLAKYKYGLDLPREERSTVIVNGRMDRARTLEYSPCVVCGEDRITHDCHVIPRTEGGPNHPDNLLRSARCITISLTTTACRPRSGLPWTEH